MRVESASRETETSFYDAAKPFWLPVARSADVAHGERMAITLLGEDLVVWRDLAGKPSVLDNLCVHRGTMLSEGRVTPAGTLACPYHGWEYRTDGACARIPQLPPGTPVPSKARVAAYPVREAYGLIWTCLAGEEAAKADVPECPDFDDEAWFFHAGVPSEWNCQATRMLENFLDVAHFGYLHADTFGNPEVEIVQPYSVHMNDDMLSMDARVPYLAQDPWGTPGPADAFAKVQVDYEYHYDVPFSAWIRGATAGEEYVLFVSAAPRTVGQTSVFWSFGVPRSLGVSAEDIQKREEHVFDPDRFIVEGQRPEWLPLDLSADLQMRFDALGINLRKALEHHGFPRVLLLRS
jgi:phenylpropionate dioxygenase-like ring-hydroxylating dioxygenase large terminal subunit